MNDDRLNDNPNDTLTNQPSPADIERNIERTRERMSSNIDELGERLSPDNLKRQAKDAIAGKAQDVVANVGDQARETGNRMLDFITENPLPVAAVDPGRHLAVLDAEGQPERGLGRPYGAVRLHRARAAGAERPADLGRRLADRAESLRESVATRPRASGDRVGELTGRMQERAGELGSAAERAGARTRAAGSSA